MNAFFKRFALLATMATLLAVPSAKLMAQQKPVGIVAISSVDEILGDLEHIGELTGQSQLASIEFLARIYTEGIDTSKPAGVIITMKGEDPIGTAFVPVKDYDTIISRIEEQFGESEDVGNGISKFTAQTEIFVKEQAGFAIASNDKASLKLVPKDPTQAIQGFQKNYDVSARIYVKNIPDSLKDQAIEQMKAGFEAGAQDLDEDLAEAARENNVKQLTQFIKETDEFAFGMAINKEKKTSNIDIRVSALPNTNLAKQMAGLYSAKTNFAGLLNTDAAVRMNLTTKGSPADAQQLVTLMKGVRNQVAKEIDDSDDFDDDATREAVKKAMNSLLDVAEDTAKTGVMDGGAFLTVDGGKLAAVAGGFVADGEKLEQAVKDLAAAMKDQTDPLDIKFNAGKHGDVNIHTLSAPVVDDEAQRVFGKRVDVAIGTGPKTVMVAMGSDAVGQLKAVLDKSKVASGTETKPLFMQAKVGQLIKFAASVQDDQPMLQELAEKIGDFAGRDRVTIQVRPIERGAVYSIEVEDGVLEMVGEMVPEDDGF